MSSIRTRGEPFFRFVNNIPTYWIGYLLFRKNIKEEKGTEYFDTSGKLKRITNIMRLLNY